MVFYVCDLLKWAGKKCSAVHDVQIVTAGTDPLGSVPGARLELAQEFNLPTDFKSVASADSATRACALYRKRLEARGGIEPPYIGFADPCITTLLPRPAKTGTSSSCKRVRSIGF